MRLFLLALALFIVFILPSVSEARCGRGRLRGVFANRPVRSFIQNHRPHLIFRR